MRSSTLPLFLLLAIPVATIAQQPVPAHGLQMSGAAPMSLYTPPTPQPCSIAALRATQGSSSQFRRTNDGRSTPVMRPRLTLTPRDRRAILSATVTAHGYPDTPGTMNLIADASSGQHNPTGRLIAKTLVVSFQPNGNGSFTAQLVLPGFSAVTMIDLNAVRFADHTTWRVANQGECRIAPDPLLLVAAD